MIKQILFNFFIVIILIIVTPWIVYISEASGIWDFFGNIITQYINWVESFF